MPAAADTPPPEARGSLLQIGEVAERVGLSLRTVRYYEEVGLLTPSARTPGGFRLYSEEDVERLAVLKGMKPFGLTLEEIRELMQLLDGDEGAGRDAVEAALRRYADRAEARVRELHAHAAEVRRLRIRIGDRLGELRDDG
ncbi:MAG TPA: MerR family transcriptional regulator [Solirubrobacteraceae bacterium]|nr:MerR family transcriptional regulator [Solirubrobacteraceae bacterium]